MKTLSMREFGRALAEKASLNMVPLSGTFELTPKCNFRCKMCYVRLDSGQMAAIGAERTTEDWISIGRQAADMGCLTLLLTGGEPFLRPDIKQIYEALINMGFLITIYSNASLVTEEIVQWLCKSPPQRIRVTLYGASNETYEKVCGDPLGYDRAVRGVTLLQQAGLPLNLFSTIIKENEPDRNAMAAFAAQRQLPFTSTAFVNPPVRGAVSSALTSRLCVDKVKTVVKNMPPQTYGNFSPYADPLARCNGIKSSFWVTWDGRMTLCSMATDLFTYPFEMGFRQAWQELGKLLNQVKPPQECVKCEYKRFCQSCIGVFCSETGSSNLTNDRICSIAKARFAYSNKLSTD